MLNEPNSSNYKKFIELSKVTGENELKKNDLKGLYEQESQK